MDGVFGQGLAQQHFGAARLGDVRRVKRLVKAADHILRQPVGTLPQKMNGNWAELTGLYRLMAAEEVTHQAVLEPHRQQVLKRMREHDGGVVLEIHDASELNYTHVEALHDQLGPVGSGRGNGRGYIAHHTLAVTPQRQVLGLLSQVLHRRRTVRKRETAAQKRAHPRRESRLWLKGCEADGGGADGGGGGGGGGAPAGCTWIDIADRGSDTFEFLAYEQSRGRRYVIRSARDRTLAGDDHVGDDRIHHHLHAYARDLPELGTRTIEVSAQAGKRQARQATIRVAAGPVILDPHRWTRGAHDGQPIDAWVIHVKEIDAPAGVTPLEWILLSNLPAHTFGQACQLIDFYAVRPIIEDYHKGLKTGLGIERLQFAHAARLEPAIALLSVCAALLLTLRHAARQHDADRTAAHTIVPVLFVRILSARLHGTARDDLSVSEFLRGVARLGGHLGRKRDGPPGWLTLWRGWNALQVMIQATLAIRGGA